MTQNIEVTPLNKFIESCKNGNLDDIKQILSEYPNINIHIYNESAFHIACLTGRLEVVEYLLELPIEVYGKIDIHMYGDYFFTLACGSGNLDLVKYLFELPENSKIYGSIPINIHADLEYSFRMACEWGNLNLVKYLLSRDIYNISPIDIHVRYEKPYRTACTYGHVDIVKYLLSYEVESIYGKINIHGTSDEGFYTACHEGHLKLVKYLCEICENYSYKIKEEDEEYDDEEYDDISYGEIIPIVSYKIDIDKLQIIEVKDEDKVKCIICNEIIDIIHLNCNKDSSKLSGKDNVLSGSLDKDSSKLSGKDSSKLSGKDNVLSGSLNKDNNPMHCYCLACLNEIYRKFHKCSYCFRPININNIQKVNVLSLKIEI